VWDARFSGAAAVACDELGLRATVYLEVFGQSGADMVDRFEPNRALPPLERNPGLRNRATH
jgi:hypothetical protein